MNEFDDLTDLDDVFGPLRSVARPAELSQESATVDLMVKAHRTSEGKHMLTSRRARIATLVATGVLGFGGMAAASPSMGGDKPADVPAAEATVAEESIVEEQPVIEQPIEEPAVEAPVVEEQAVEPQVVEEPVAAEQVLAAPDVDGPDPDLDTDFNEANCVIGNHGKTVSAVARGDYDIGELADDVTVKEAAQSSCGKDEVDEVDVDVEVESDVDVDDEVESDADVDDEADSEESEPKAERPSRSDKAAEKSANNGNGNGKGKQDD